MSNKKKLHKVRRGKKLCGVCAGIADYFDLDVTLVRILFLALILFWGGGLILYIGCALLMPEDEE